MARNERIRETKREVLRILNATERNLDNELKALRETFSMIASNLISQRKKAKKNKEDSREIDSKISKLNKDYAKEAYLTEERVLAEGVRELQEAARLLLKL